MSDFNLQVRKGEMLALLGPSGCGKTTTLRMLAGFVPVSSGSILLEGRDITSIPPFRRNIGMVFQGYALFPHMSVHENVAFGLRMRKLPVAEIDARVRASLERVRLASLANHMPRQLSGGQQQRVALARAMAINPDVLLLDEPLSALDARLRQEVREEIRELQRSLGLTTVIVTHDQDEALSMSDRMVVMNGGHIEQFGEPAMLYERPANRFVAEFLGKSNFIPGSIVGPGLFRTSTGEILGFAADETSASASCLSFRPERASLSVAHNGPHADLAACINTLAGRVTSTTYLGHVVEYKVVTADSLHILVLEANRASVAIEPGAAVQVRWAKSDSRLLE